MSGEKSVKQLAQAYETGTLTIEERQKFESTLENDENALNALGGFYSAYQAKTGVSQQVEGQFGNPNTPMAIKGELLTEETGTPDSGMAGLLRGVLSGISRPGARQTRAAEEPPLPDAMNQDLEPPVLSPSGLLRFKWRPVRNVSRYSVVISRNMDNREVWSGSTFLSWLDLPPSTRLHRGQDYMWRLAFQVGSEEIFLYGTFRSS